MFNEDLLIQSQSREPYFNGQHIDPAPPSDIINKEK